MIAWTAVLISCAFAAPIQDHETRCRSRLEAIWKEIESNRSPGAPLSREGFLDAAATSQDTWLCVATDRPFRIFEPDVDLIDPPPERDPILGDPVDRGRGGHVLYRDGTVRFVERGTPEWSEVLRRTTEWRGCSAFYPGAVWVWRTSRDPSERMTTRCEEVVLEGDVKLLALDTTAGERALVRDLCYPADEGMRLFKRVVEGRPVPAPPDPAGRREADAWLDALFSDDPFERAGAADKLVPLWFHARDRIESLLESTRDPEVASKLRGILAAGVQTSGPLLWSWPLRVGRSWTNPLGGGRVEVLDEEMIVTSMGPAVCFKVAAESETERVTTWFNEEFGPVVVQFSDLRDGSRVEWRLESFTPGTAARLSDWACFNCGRFVEGARRAPDCPTCRTPMRSLEDMREGPEFKPEPAPVPEEMPPDEE